VVCATGLLPKRGEQAITTFIVKEGYKKNR